MGNIGDTMTSDLNIRRENGKIRTQIPKNVEYEILFKNDMKCCICHDKTKGVIIHHIDENPSNNSIDNLAILCQDHHDEVHSKGGLTKHITPQVLIRYKRQWESFNFNKMKVKISPIYPKMGIQKVLFEFEIRKTTYEILSLDKDDIEGLKQKLEYLYSIHMLEGYSSEILGALDNISVLISFDDTKAALIAEDVHHYVWHLVGPRDVPLSKDYRDNLFKILNILSTLGSFSSQFSKSRKVISSLLVSFEYLANISIEYDLDDLAKKIINEMEKIIKTGEVGLEKESEFNTSVTQMNEFLIGFKTLIKQKKSKWDFVN